MGTQLLPKGDSVAPGGVTVTVPRLLMFSQSRAAKRLLSEIFDFTSGERAPSPRFSCPGTIKCYNVFHYTLHFYTPPPRSSHPRAIMLVPLVPPPPPPPPPFALSSFGRQLNCGSRKEPSERLERESTSSSTIEKMDFSMRGVIHKRKHMWHS